MRKKEDKKKDVKSLHELLKSTQSVFVTAFVGLKVQQDFRLRKTVRGAGGNYRVVKNTLVERAAKGTPSEPVLKQLTGMTSLAYTSGDPAALAKALTKYAKENPTLTFKAGVVEGRVIDVSEIKVLAEMPSRGDLFAKLLYLIQASAQNLARAIGGVGRNVAVVIDQGLKESKFSA